MDNLEEDDANSQNNCRMSEYADHLRVWLNRAYQWQCMPYSMPLVQNRYSSQRFQSFANQNEINDNFVPFQQAPVQQAAAGRTIPAALPEQRPNETVYVVPKLSKRFLAELIDFSLLLLIKAVVALTILESFDIEELYAFDDDDIDDGDYDFAMKVTSNLLTIEYIHRVLVLFYEVWFTQYGGATPGKRTMGIKIISCQTSTPIGEDQVAVQMGSDMGFWKAFSRAFLKNLGAALLFPTYVQLLFVQNNRTLYDIVCGTIVVESD